MRIIYDFGIFLYSAAIRIASLWNPKASEWLSGRRAQQKRKANKNHLLNPIWIHAASLGEFEQGKPLIEALRLKFPSKPILLSFFSPSGMKDDSSYNNLVQDVIYLPLDTKSNAIKFLADHQPAMAIFIKYEIWYHFLHQLRQRNIPTFITSGAFRNSQWFFQWPFSRMTGILKGLTQIFVQTEESQKLLQNKGFKNVTLSGDGRIDRVELLPSESARMNFNFPPTFEQVDLIAGSTHAQDYPVILKIIKESKLRAIVVPHDIVESEISKLEAFFEKKCFRFTRWQNGKIGSTDIEECNVMIVDTIGMLKYLYRFTSCVYIGGGFSSGIHSILEPASFRIPIIFGPKHEKFPEARKLMSLGIAISIQNQDQFEDAFYHFEQLDKNLIKDQFDVFFKEHTGATKKIMKYILENNILL